MLIKCFAIVALVKICAGFGRDENYYHNENDTLVELFWKTMDLTDYNAPSVDKLGCF